MRILIAGAGIGGLTTALSLHAAGFQDIVILEAAPRIEPIGVGLNILPNAVRELDELGLAEELYSVAVHTGSLSYCNRFGSLIWNEPRGCGAGYHWPQLSIHRGRLQAVLLAAVRERLHPDTVVPGTSVAGFGAAPDGSITVHAQRTDGSGTFYRGDLLVAADGIHSAVRACMHPGAPGPRWNGILLWRGTTWAAPFLDSHTMIIAGDRERRCVVYPMSTDPDGGKVLVNWALARRCHDGEMPGRADWNRRVAPERFLGYFEDLVFDWLDVPAMVRATEETMEYPMVDIDPLPHWTSGRATLLGDAAHAMPPMGSNGATQAILDGRVLASKLATHGDIDKALREYEEARRPAMTELQRAARRMGPEIVIDLVDERAPSGFTEVSDVMTETELADISRRYAQLGSFDVQTVNKRSSYSVLPVDAVEG